MARLILALLVASAAAKVNHLSHPLHRALHVKGGSSSLGPLDSKLAGDLGKMARSRRYLYCPFNLFEPNLFFLGHEHHGRERRPREVRRPRLVVARSVHVGGYLYDERDHHPERRVRVEVTKRCLSLTYAIDTVAP